LIFWGGAHKTLPLFSGIVEAVQPILKAEKSDKLLRVWIEKPSFFNDLKTGDSMCINGVCLTLEQQTGSQLVFALAFETLNVLKKLDVSASAWVGQKVNLERSLKFGDRIHGHLVTGHVESLGKVLRSFADGESWFLDVQIEKELLPFVWKKGSITLHGVSLTVNSVEDSVVQVCLIPETQKRTNLTDIPVGDYIHVEPDYMAKAMVRALQMGVIKNAD
jgi:riboflavin synthase